MILLDLGGVLVEFTGIDPLIELCNGSLTPEQARRFWLESPWIRKLDIGQCDPQEFAKGIVSELGLSVSPEALMHEFKSWEKGPYPGAMELLDQIKDRYLLCCLSNNNELHWNLLNDMSGISNKFDKCYLSYQLAIRKPDLQIYKYVLNDMKILPEHTLFLDDNPECVEAAKKAGMDAEQVQGIENVKRVLETKKIIIN